MSDITPTAGDNKIHANAVFEGGGVRGIGHVGAVAVAEQLGYQWDYIAGTSAGAIAAALLAAGYSAAEMYDIMSKVDFRRFAEDSGLDRLLVTKVFKVLTRAGIHSGSYIEEFMREKLEAKGVKEFGDLRIKGEENNPNPFRRYRLTLIASDISTASMLRLPQDAHLYGLDPDALNIARVVRMSASIPFFFVPINLMHADGTISSIVDGGLLSNFPLFLFDEEGQAPDRPTLGFRLVDPEPPHLLTHSGPLTATNRPIEVIRALINTMLNAHDKLYMDDHTYVRTISIPVDGIKATQFDLSKEQAEKLYQNGRDAAKKFFSTWDFEAYKVTYHNNWQPPSRQKRLHAEMKTIQQISQQLTTTN